MTVPRRRAKGGNERLRNALASTGARSGDGRTGEARPVIQKPQPQLYQPPATGSDGIIATGSFDCSDTSSFTTALNYDAPFDHDRGSAPGVWAPNGSGDGIDALIAGAFDAFVTASITGADPGDVFQLLTTGSGQGSCYAIADPAGVAYLSVRVGIGFVLTAPAAPLFTAAVAQISGTGTAPVLGGVEIDLTQISWNGN